MIRPIVLLAVAAALALAGCGKKSALKTPPAPGEMADTAQPETPDEAGQDATGQNEGQDEGENDPFDDYDPFDDEFDD